MNEIADRIRELARIYHSEVIAIRRHIHAHPELSCNEEQTASFVIKQLRSYGLEPRSGIAGHGVTTTIVGKMNGSGVILLRADMDALPIEESNELSYRSQNNGVMHACGHDAHTACLLGAARILQELSPYFGGSIKLVFQPSEERYPGGAIGMINEGILSDPEVHFAFGQHVYPELETGMVGFCPGQYMASTDEIHITVKGKGGHAAIPRSFIDPVLTAAQILISLQQIVSRKAPPIVPTVLSFGRFIADGRTNIIPDTAKLEGTLRTFDESWRAQAHQLIRDQAILIAKASGAEAEVFIDKGYPSVINNEELTGLARVWAIELLGNEYVADIEPRMTAEDFAYFSRAVPSVFYRLGIRNEEKGIVSGLHTPTFNIDEKSLETGMAMMAWLGIRALKYYG
jgi:amidohydrolase